MSKLIFFCVSSALLLFSIIVINILPPLGGSWYDESCNSISDDQKYLEDKTLNDLGGITQDYKNDVINIYKRNKKICNRKKAMVALQYTAFNLNIIFGFVCAFLGFLQYLEIKNIEITGIIGLGCGFIGFVLTLVFVIESGLVFNDIDDSNNLRIDSDGAVLELKDSNYKCIFYDKNDKFALYRRYSDYGNKFLNYKKEVKHMNEDKNYEYIQCSYSLFGSGNSFPYGPSTGSSLNYLSKYNALNILEFNKYCKNLEEKITSLQKMEYRDDTGKSLGDCNKLYLFLNESDNEKKNLYDRWLTSIILSCFILLLNIGVAVFGFLLFNSSGKTNL